MYIVVKVWACGMYVCVCMLQSTVVYSSGVQTCGDLFGAF